MDCIPALSAQTFVKGSLAAIPCLIRINYVCFVGFCLHSIWRSKNKFCFKGTRVHVSELVRLVSRLFQEYPSSISVGPPHDPQVGATFYFALIRSAKCKSTCKVKGINNLLACRYCFNKAFDKFYYLHAATRYGGNHQYQFVYSTMVCIHGLMAYDKLNTGLSIVTKGSGMSTIQDSTPTTSALHSSAPTPGFLLVHVH
ncbi:hypothetical protein TIFTF001_016186 [Ficus carica]|uniref:Uncharacterized protein n=1 Tax=Ficus carica TaxID=3494 RepID=A0AA88A2N8_FICCA|nr:hypothetical protein TIFTF001_016186 [Ficus carica]